MEMKNKFGISLEDFEDHLSKMSKGMTYTPDEKILEGCPLETLLSLKEKLELERTTVELDENKPYYIAAGLMTGKGGKILILNLQIRNVEVELEWRNKLNDGQ